MKSCPYCDGQLMDAVVRCVHCGKDLNTPDAEAIVARKAEQDPSAFPGAPANPLAAASALPVAGGPPSINQAPAAEPEPDFSDQPQYFAMKTEMTPPGAARPVNTKARAGVSSGNGIAAMSAWFAVLAAIAIGVAMFFLPLASVKFEGKINLGPQIGSVDASEIPEETATLFKPVPGSGPPWEAFVIGGCAIGLLLGGFSYITSKETKAMRGPILVDAVILGGMVFKISNDFKNMDEILQESAGAAAAEVPPEVAAMLGPGELDKLIQAVIDAMVITKGPALMVISVGAVIAFLAGILGLMIKKEPTMSTMASAPPPPAVPPPVAPPAAAR